ncbi:hypothetical protein GCM10009760_46990 [Kitasatospora kazusensis]|uniref:Uncharacterized protein n=1 Tax=Kitasatospora kazusensis TaxID=407974 RepID=A0ABP5LPV8_9ACTN
MSAVRRRLPDEVRSAAVRAWLYLSCTVVALLVAGLASIARSPLLTPALLATALGVFGTAWGLLDIVIARQIAAQRLRGPNSASPLAGSRPPKQRKREQQERERQERLPAVGRKPLQG